MAHLATVGSHAVNGVAALHSRLLRETVLRDFAEMWPERFTNMTNGVTPRRFIALANPASRDCSTRRSAGGWLSDLGPAERTGRPGRRCGAAATVAAPSSGRTRHGSRTACGLTPVSRSIRTALRHAVQAHPRVQAPAPQRPARHRALPSAQAAASLEIAPRTFIFAGKAAPGYTMAKLMIRLINAVADTVTADPEVRDAHAGSVYPELQREERASASIRRPISPSRSRPPGKEASGTGNMKFMMNGALTIGTLDGANVEIRERSAQRTSSCSA